jgi:hypothetical protein
MHRDALQRSGNRYRDMRAEALAVLNQHAPEIFTVAVPEPILTAADEAPNCLALNVQGDDVLRLRVRHERACPGTSCADQLDCCGSRGTPGSSSCCGAESDLLALSGVIRIRIPVSATIKRRSPAPNR